MTGSVAVVPVVSASSANVRLAPMSMTRSTGTALPAPLVALAGGRNEIRGNTRVSARTASKVR